MKTTGGGVWLRVLVVAAVAAGIGHYFFGLMRGTPPAPASPPAQTPAPAPPPAVPPAPALPPAPAVRLEDSDAWIRAHAPSWLSSPRLSAWLGADRLVRRLASAAVLVADGRTPRDALDFLDPGKDFSVRKKGGRLVIDPRSYARYDAVANAAASLNAAAFADAFRSLEPLLEGMCAELQCGPGGFRGTLARAIRQLQATPVPEGDVRVYKRVLTYRLTDPKLEGLSAAQKHLLRMGPRNAAKIKGKLAELSKALGLPG